MATFSASYLASVFLLYLMLKNFKKYKLSLGVKMFTMVVANQQIPLKPKAEQNALRPLIQLSACSSHQVISCSLHQPTCCPHCRSTSFERCSAALLWPLTTACCYAAWLWRSAPFTSSWPVCRLSATMPPATPTPAPACLRYGPQHTHMYVVCMLMLYYLCEALCERCYINKITY